jgi:response regulator receiver modulated diguanylate cyclase
MIQEIYIIDDKPDLRETLKRLFKEDRSYRFKSVPTESLDIALKNIPSLIIINEDNIDEDIISICQKIKKDDDNSITPVIVLSSNKNHTHRINLLKLGVSHYIINPINEDFFYYTIQNTLKLIYINRRVSPLTGLPGNVQIQAEMKKRFSLKETFAMIYIDLDNFKAYNDIYGFLKGDQIIKFTAKIILKNVHTDEYEDSFVGHIGGDDFVAIVSETDYERICQNIITDFDSNVSKFFTEDDVNRGYFEVANRKGIMEQFPLTSISIGVVEVEVGRFANVLEIGEAGASVKHLAKTIQGSTYVIDRRKNGEK